MSVTVYVSAPTTTVRSQCECCDGTGWDFNVPDSERGGPFDPIPEGDRCWTCEGSGVVDEQVWPVEPVQMSNQSAAVAFRALGLPVEFGEVEATEVHAVLRRGIRLQNSVGVYDDLAVEGCDLPGGHMGTRIVEGEDGIARIERMGSRFVGAGVSAEGAEIRVLRVLSVFREAARLGCGVHWG